MREETGPAPLSSRTRSGLSVQERLAQGVQDALRTRSKVGGVQPISEGLFAPARRPLVIDANMLYGEVLRLARAPGETKLVTLARLGFLNVLVAGHVADEVDEHLKGWCLKRSLDYAVAHERWSNDLRPVVTVVILSSETVAELATPGEAARLKILAESNDPELGDPDDVPTAALALLLQAPLLSKDSAPLKAVYGPNTERSLHADYLEALTAGGQLHILREATTVGAMIADATVSGAYHAGRQLISRIGPAPIVTALAALAALLAVRKQGGRSNMIRPLSERLGAALAEVAQFYGDAEAAYATLVRPQTCRHEIGHDRQELRLEILAWSSGKWSEADDRMSTDTT